ncbi:unnamed protein product [Psylliodes chrysocephalus]|uniref:Uncharacterized protein n=1 Tax=Psylliodes chrysocephalus TaxID=3402493 RepID=A0A9P0D4W4_9CUCU|nr:unnamed protein product [Psylliodes chrysocephala]
MADKRSYLFADLERITQEEILTIIEGIQSDVVSDIDDCSDGDDKTDFLTRNLDKRAFDIESLLVFLEKNVLEENQMENVKREIVMEKNIVTILQINLMIKEVEEPNKTIIRKTNVENYMIISVEMEIQENTRKYKEIQGNTKKYKEIQGNTRKYKEIQGNTKKYKEIQGNTKKYKEIQRNTRKYKETQGNARKSGTK